LRDVQLLAGHKSIEITQGYIDGDTHGQRRLVTSLELSRALALSYWLAGAAAIADPPPRH
jgi:hypothetical protein